MRTRDAAMMGRDRVILDAAAKLFHDKGFELVGVHEIGERAGVSGSAIYRHFRSKEDILLTLFDEALDRFFAEVGSAPGEDAQAAFAHMVRTHSQQVLGHLEWASVAVREGRSLPPDSRRRVRRREQQYMDRWADVIVRYAGLEHDVAVTAAYAVVGMINSVVQWPRSAVASAHLEDQLVSMALHAVSGFAADADTP